MEKPKVKRAYRTSQWKNAIRQSSGVLFFFILFKDLFGFPNAVVTKVTVDFLHLKGSWIEKCSLPWSIDRQTVSFRNPNVVNPKTAFIETKLLKLAKTPIVINETVYTAQRICNLHHVCTFFNHTVVFHNTATWTCIARSVCMLVLLEVSLGSVIPSL